MGYVHLKSFSLLMESYSVNFVVTNRVSIPATWNLHYLTAVGSSL
jgi:hypothetical protein